MARRQGTQPDTAGQLLDATSALMIERNSVDISFSEIAGKSGVNAALIRYHFGSKNGMFMALLERDTGGSFAELKQLVNSDMSAVQKLRHHVHGIVKIYFRFPYMNRLVAALVAESDSETARLLSERFTRPLVAAQQSILEQGLREDVFRPVDPRFFHFSLIGACEHLFVARHSLRHAFGIDEIDDALRRAYAGHVTDTVMRSVLVTPEP